MKVFVSIFIIMTVLAVIEQAVSQETPPLHNFREGETILDKYMAAPDTHYGYKLSSQTENAASTVYILNMTSLAYLTPAQVDRPIWTHCLTIVVPKNLNKNLRTASLLVNGGDNINPIPSGDINYLVMVAGVTRSIIADLTQIPNQPIVFSSDPKKKQRTEDDITAFTWRHFLNNTKDSSSTDWIIQLPMAKSAKLAMDTMQSFINSIMNVKSGQFIENFTVLGGSKRGWTTWLVAATDKRVKTIVPIVIQVLNIKKILEHVYNSLCSWPQAMGAYAEQGVLDLLETKEFSQLAQIVDPFIYRERYSNINKFIVNGLGDIFFWPDLALYSYPDLPGSDDLKRIRYIPNVGHSMTGSDIWETILTFSYATLYNKTLPTYTFSHNYAPEGAYVQIRILNGVIPFRVTLWAATNEKARDFRITETGKSFEPTTIRSTTPDNPWSYNVFVPNPAKGWTAFSVEMEFGLATNGFPIPLPPIKFSSAGYVTPTTLPCKYPGGSLN